MPNDAAGVRTHIENNVFVRDATPRCASRSVCDPLKTKKMPAEMNTDFCEAASHHTGTHQYCF